MTGRFYLSEGDYNALIESGGDDARAAVRELHAKTSALWVATSPIVTKLEDTSLRRFEALAETEVRFGGDEGGCHRLASVAAEDR